MSKSQDNQREAVYLSYLAGIMDGEGTIRIGSAKPNGKSKQNIKYYSAVSVGNTNKEVLEMFVNKFGSKVREDKRVPNRKRMYRWGTSGNITVPKILKQLLPYLVIKKEQAKIVIEFAEGYKRISNRKRECKKCKEIKEIQGLELCTNCYMFERRHKRIDKYKKNYVNQSHNLPTSELLRREEFYNKVRKLNS